MGDPLLKTGRWKRVRKLALSRDRGFCVLCERNGTYKLATEVDHITPISDGGKAFDLDNLQSLCRWHHITKTAKENRMKARAKHRPNSDGWLE